MVEDEDFTIERRRRVRVAVRLARSFVDSAHIATGVRCRGSRVVSDSLLSKPLLSKKLDYVRLSPSLLPLTLP